VSIQRKMKRVSLVEKLCFVLGLNEKDAQEIAKKIKVDGFEDRSHSELDPVTIESILNNPQVVEDIRLNPNKITLKQIQQIPRLKPELVETVLKGRPYYSIDELKKATDLPHNLLDDLFSIPPFRFHDKLAKKEVLFSPVYGRYITPPASEFEEQVKKAGYVQVYLPTKNLISV
jgi:DNA uptake protein ComE-like DNA-binding protein